MPLIKANIPRTTADIVTHPKAVIANRIKNIARLRVAKVMVLSFHYRGVMGWSWLLHEIYSCSVSSVESPLPSTSVSGCCG